MGLIGKRKTQPQRRPPAKPAPTELWLLSDARGNWVTAMEADDQALPLLAMTSKRDADKVARDHETMYGVACRPVRVI